MAFFLLYDGVSDWPIHQDKSYYFWLVSPNSIHILNYKVAQCDTKKTKNSVKVNLPFFTLLGKDWTRFAPNIRCTYNFDHFSHQKYPFTKVLEKEIFFPNLWFWRTVQQSTYSMKQKNSASSIFKLSIEFWNWND